MHITSVWQSSLCNFTVANRWSHMHDVQLCTLCIFSRHVKHSMFLENISHNNYICICTSVVFVEYLFRKQFESMLITAYVSICSENAPTSVHFFPSLPSLSFPLPPILPGPLHSEGATHAVQNKDTSSNSLSGRQRNS